MTARFGLGKDSFVVEVASNDGYLLQYFVKRDVPVLGIEPAGNVAKVAMEKGVPTVVRSSARHSRANSSPMAAMQTWRWAITCWPRCPTSTTLSKASKSC